VLHLALDGGEVGQPAVGRITGALTAENAPDAPSSLDEYRAQTARIGESLAHIFSADPRVPRLLLFEAPGIDKAMSERILDLFEVAAAYLSHGVELGYLRADLDIDGTANAINGMILASAISSVRAPDPEHQRRLSEAVRRVMYDGIAARD
jgi:hypothetical protein